MTNFRKHIVSSLLAMLLITGLVCLNLHSLTHLGDYQTESHQADSAPLNKISDDCVLCLVSGSSFADLAIQSFSTVWLKSKILLLSDIGPSTYQTISVKIPRAPPFVLFD